MAENPIIIGIDWSKSPLRVAGLVDKSSGRYIVIKGSKVVKADTDGTPNRGELIRGFRDAIEIVQSSLGATDIQSSVVVVPNATVSHNRDAIAFLSDNNSNVVVNVVSVVSEYTAVAAAYGDKSKPNKTKTLAVISTTSDIIDVCVVSVQPTDLLNEIYEYTLAAQKTHLEKIDFEKMAMDLVQQNVVVTLATKLPVVGDYVESVASLWNMATDVLKKLLGSSELSQAPAVDAVVFVGNVSVPKLLRQAVEERYPDAKIWDDIDADEVAAYGGAVLAVNNAKKTATATATATATEEEDGDGDGDGDGDATEAE